MLGRIWVRGNGQVHLSDDVVLDARAAPIELFAHRGGEIRIGPGVRIEGGASLEAVSQVVIEAGAKVGSFCKILDNHFHLVGGSDRSRRPPSRPVVVEEQAVLGARAILLPGARVGRGAMVPPGAVVSRNFGAVAAPDQPLAGATGGTVSVGGPVLIAGSDVPPRSFRERMGGAIGIARAAWYLRGCKRSARVRTTGSVRVLNEGTVQIGERTEFLGGMIPSEIACRPGASIEIGSSSLFNYGVSLEAWRSIRIGSRVMFGSFVRISDRRSGAAGPIAIGDDVWIAHGATIEPGVTIGRGSVVAAGSVVLSDVPPGSLAIGNPARCMRLSLRAEQPRGPTAAQDVKAIDMNPRARIRRFIVETFFVDDFADDQSFLRSSIIDSLGMVELVAYLEKEFGIKIADAELIPDNLDSLARASAFVERKRRLGTSAA